MPDTLPPVRWQPDRIVVDPAGVDPAVPPMMTALGRGLRGRCPVCGVGLIFNGYLKLRPVCTACAAPLGLVRADDIPPYFTMLVVGHIIIPGMLILEQAKAPPIWMQMALWVPLTLVLTLGLLRPIKGATVALMLRLGMLKPESDA